IHCSDGTDKDLTSRKPIRYYQPKTVEISMNQAAGSSCEVIVNIGDRVSKGQLIGKATKFGAANIHASIGGTVQDIVTTKDTQDNDVTYVVIETDTPEETGERDRIL